MSLPNGVLPAAVTPFDERGRVDEAAVIRLLAYFQSQGCAGVVLAGTNGEGPSLSAVEKRDLVKLAVSVSPLPVVLGVATPSLEEAAWLIRQAADAEAAGVLLMPPFFYRDAPEAAIEAWFRTLLDRATVPVLLYNFPQKTGIALSAELVSRLASHERCAGLKDSSGAEANIETYAGAMPQGRLYIGDENLLVTALRHRWCGTISGAANSIPGWLAAICRDAGEVWETAEAKAEWIAPALRAIRGSVQPSGHKCVLVDRGVLSSARVRLPLIDIAESDRDTLVRTIRRLG